MIKGIADELRSLAERCTRSACECTDCEMSHALEELAVDLMAKAAELERRFDR
jgi:hypothetical protein